MEQVKSLINYPLNYKKILVLGIFGFALIALPVTIALLQNQQDFRQLAAKSNTVILEPVEDTYVDSINQNTNYASSSGLRVNWTNGIKTAFLKFDLSSLKDATITNAILRIYVEDPSADPMSLKSVADDNWNESITYATQPAVGESFANFGNTARNTWKVISVTNKVNEEKGQIFSLAVTSAKRDMLVFHSANTTGTKPKLEVTYNMPATPTITNSPSIPITTLTPIIDPPPSTDACASAAADIVLLIDKSSSMNQEIGAAKRAAKLFVDKIAQNPSNKISLMTFDHDVAVTPLTDDFESVKTAIAAIKDLTWGTCIQCAIDKANTEFSERGRSGLNKSIVLLTDGRPTRTASGGAATEIAEEAAFQSIKTGFATHGYTLFNIGIGNGVKEEFMQETAQYTGGKYYHAPVSADLDEIYLNIATVIGKSTVSGMVYNDVNNSSTKDASESGLQGWSVKLQEVNGSYNQSTTTSAESNYSFSGLCAGKTYRLSQTVQSGWRQTTPQNPDYYELTINSGVPNDSKDFGNVKITKCTDGIDNDSNGYMDRRDSSCHTDWNPDNAGSYNPDLAGENGAGESCADSKDNNSNGTIDGADPICHTDGSAGNPQSFDPNLSEFDPNADVILNLKIFLHGIGLSGDNRNPASDFSNKNPVHSERKAVVEVFNNKNQLKATVSAFINYASASGSFTGVANVGKLSAGGYTVKVKTEQHLKLQIPGIQNVASGGALDLQTVALVSGDVNNDNRLDILDYNILYGCYTSDLMPTPKNCNETNAVKTDLNDEGKVNLFDLNLFIRELSVQSGA